MNAALPQAFARSDRMSDATIEALTDAADAAAVAKARESLAGTFVRAVEAACKPSTPRVPVFTTYCASDEGEPGPKRYRHVMRLQPITIVLHDLLSQADQTDDVLLTYVINPERVLSARALHIIAMSRLYAEANAVAAADLGWSEA